MLDKKLIRNYRLSLEQKYNAVCFDIDGTLTEKNSKKIDERAIEMIADLLKRKVPVVFITGRGETGLNDLKNDVYLKLKNIYQVSNNELYRMYALTNDGARLFFTIKNMNDNDSIFSDNLYISTENELNQLKLFNDTVVKRLRDSAISDICNITYSKDLKTKTILNIRIIFKVDDKKLIDSVFDIIQDIIRNDNLDAISITRGIYKDKNVIQIGTSKKSKAIEKTEKIIGVPKNSMIRIGDCGDKMGNDYSMLNCEHGYSVDKTSGDIDSCFPIIDENGEILKGIDATIYLVKHAKILPTVCLESAIKTNYVYEYAKIEKEIIKGKNGHLKFYNEIVNRKFDLINGIDDLFDKSSGSIKIPMYEWELIKNNPLKDFWNIQNGSKLFYSMRDNNNYLLRGSKTYYYFLANRRSVDGEDMTTSDDVIEWYHNTIEFLNNAYSAVSISTDINSNVNLKFILGLLDNIRNILLILINHKLNNEYLNKNILLNLESDNNGFYNIYKSLYFVEDLMSKICFHENFNLPKDNILELIKLTSNELKNEFFKVKDNLNLEDYSKEYRAYREIDNFAENYITVKLNEKKNKQSENFGVCGMCYGGIELPILYKLINQNISDVLILKFNKQVSGYANKQLVDLRKFNIRNYGNLLMLGEIKNNNIVMLDDNVLTGKTMQLALNTLYDFGMNVSNINIVRYPSVNRIDQMFMNGHGAIDYNLFFDYITGLCFHSPYSWRDENNLNKYEDSLGIFDLNRRKIIECLIKNHDYKENSEVAQYKRRIKK